MSKKVKKEVLASEYSSEHVLAVNTRKDLLFVTSFAFCVITFEPIMIQTYVDV